ncbi:hypothetical protein CXB51_003474 [Gossypium anomalum]|uniref:Integrase catalytic domain-containing protein n=1 Tax=Gossypium anomalum TaxID=47600 RepID=A0A8J6D7I0_9ROSI|nr:hypothetical protein CXB51_003474 [Gossypium anomalum]
MFKQLGLGELKPTRMSIQLANRSVKYPRGIVEDVLVKVDKFIFPIDFFVLDMDEDVEVPLILGRPFLATARAVIDVGDGKLVLREEVKDDESMRGKRKAELNSNEPSLRQKSYEGIEKGGMTVVVNEKNELIPTRTVTGWRVCIDYRKLNDATRKDHFPLPFIDQMLERLSGHMYYCFLDGLSGYFQIPKASEDQEKMTFTLMHVSHFYELVEDIMEIVLGHKISSKGIKVDKAKVETIEKLPPPNSVEAIRSFLGHARFYRRFIKDFSKIAKPLTNLLEKDVPFNFNQECLEAFNTLKDKLINAPIVVAPDWNLLFELMCDASDFAVGAILGQRKDKHFQLINYASRTLTVAQENYTMTEKELLAVEFDLEIQDKKGAENPAADHLSRLENPHLNELDEHEINDSFPEEQLFAISDSEEPWFADIVNYLAANVTPKGLTHQQKKQFFTDVKNYFWEDPFLFCIYVDQVIRRCVTKLEAIKILEHCHSRLTGGHYSGSRTAHKMLKSGFYWPTLLKDANRYVTSCDKCQRTDVDYMSKWVEAQALPTNDARVVVRFLKKFFSRFGTPRAIISDRGTHFCNAQFDKILKKYGVYHRTATPYHPQISGQVKVANRELKRILEKTLNELDEWRANAYEKSRLYKEATKRRHDARLKYCKQFKARDLVLLYNSRLKLFPGKLKSRWTGPFVVQTIFLYGTVEIMERSYDSVNLLEYAHKPRPYGTAVRATQLRDTGVSQTVLKLHFNSLKISRGTACVKSPRSCEVAVRVRPNTRVGEVNKQAYGHAQHTTLGDRRV